MKLPKIELNCLVLLKIENWIENCQKINFQFFSLSEKLKIELKIAQNQFSFVWNYWKLSKNEIDVFVHGWGTRTSVHRKCHSIFSLKLKCKSYFCTFPLLIENWKLKNDKKIFNFQFPIFIEKLKIKNLFFTFQFSNLIAEWRKKRNHDWLFYNLVNWSDVEF